MSGTGCRMIVQQLHLKITQGVPNKLSSSKSRFKRLFINTIKILSPLCFLKHQKFERVKWAQNFDLIYENASKYG
jgi:hypothetical protein